VRARGALLYAKQPLCKNALHITALSECQRVTSWHMPYWVTSRWLAESCKILLLHGTCNTECAHLAILNAHKIVGRSPVQLCLLYLGLNAFLQNSDRSSTRKPKCSLDRCKVLLLGSPMAGQRGAGFSSPLAKALLTLIKQRWNCVARTESTVKQRTREHSIKIPKSQCHSYKIEQSAGCT